MARTVGTLFGVLVIVLTLNVFECIYLPGLPGSFAKYPPWNACTNATFSFEFRTTQADTLLMYTDDNGINDFFEVKLLKGKVKLTVKIVDGKDGAVRLSKGSGLDDDQWHRVDIKRNRMETTLVVDGAEDRKVAIGSDFYFGRFNEPNNYVYFGGVPLQYHKALKTLSLPSSLFGPRLNGYIRNVFYGNCTCRTIRGQFIEGIGVSLEPREVCEVRNPCGAGCVCISTDDQPGCNCQDLECSEGSATHYYLPMDRLYGNSIENPYGLDATVHGSPKFVQGVIGKALKINGETQWIGVSGPSHRSECFGDLDKCSTGYTLGLWLQFKDASYRKRVYLSNGGHNEYSHGVAMLYSKGMLEFVFRKTNGEEWRVQSDNVLTNRWYHIAATWIQRDGLHLYVNGNLVGQARRSTRKPPAVNRDQNDDFVIGRGNDNSGLNDMGTLLVDELHFWSTFKSAKEIRESGPIYKYYLPMDEIKDNEVVAVNAEAKIVGRAQIVGGKIDNAVRLSGNKDYIDLGNYEDSCLGDISKCIYGFYISMWVSFNRLDDDTYFLATGPKGIKIYYKSQRLYGEAVSGNKHWEVYIYGLRGLDTRVWHFLEVSWNEDVGLVMYLNMKSVAFRNENALANATDTTFRNWYIGRANSGMSSENYAAATFDDIEVFYADRITLLRLGFIQRGQPTKQSFGFDAMVGTRIIHSSFMVKTYGKPRLGRGKIGRSLRLNGDKQIADLGEHNESCFGNLDNCPHGALLGLWLKPNDMKENMYFLSSGLNGITIGYNRGRLLVNAATTTREWQVSSDALPEGEWHYIEVSWHPQKGLKLYKDNKMVKESSRYVERDLPTDFSYRLDQDQFYLGRGNREMIDAHYGDASYDELQYWYGSREYLLAFGYLQRGRPMRYLINMEEIRDGRVVHPSLLIKAEGDPTIVPGKIGNAIQLDGAGQYLDLGQHTEKCLGNLARCINGMTISAWMNFRSYSNNMYYISTGENGIHMYYRSGYIYVELSQPGRAWRITVPRFEPNRWYFIEITWHRDDGLRLYVNNRLVGEGKLVDFKESSIDIGPNFFVGKANPGDLTSTRASYADLIIDEMEFWEGRRDELLAFDYIQREVALNSSDEILANLSDNVGHETFSMEIENDGVVQHPYFTVTLVNGGLLVPGKIGNAVSLDGRGAYVDLGEHADRCFGNLNLCKHGLTTTMWIKAKELTDKTYFLSGPSYSLFYRNGRLVAKYHTASKSWTVSTRKFRKDRWYHVAVSWHPVQGLSLYIDDKKVAESMDYEEVQADEPESSNVYIGRAIEDSKKHLTAKVLVDEVQYYYAPIDQLKATGQYREGGEINHESFRMEHISSGRLYHNGQYLTLIGQPTLVDGLDGKAIYLNGRGQYVDLGDNITCQGDLEYCRNGFTLRMTLKPEQLRENTYFLGSYPVSLYFKDGRLQATTRTSTKSWTVNTPAFSAGKWQLVELSWHPINGLTMYLNGQRAAHVLYPTTHAEIQSTSSKTYVGRSLSDSPDRYYADAVIDDVEFWNAHRNYLVSYNMIGTDDLPTVEPYIPSIRPPINGPPPEISRSSVATKLIQFTGNSYINYDFNAIPAEFFQRAPYEELSMDFFTNKADGLIWLHRNSDRTLHLSVKDNLLVFVVDVGGRPQQVVIPGVNVNDHSWHRLRIIRDGRKVTFYIDNELRQTYTLPRTVYFLDRGRVYVGGSADTPDLTNNLVQWNLDGTLSHLIYKSKNQNRITDLNLIEQLSNSGTNIHGALITDIRTTARTFPTLPTPRRTRPTLPPYTPPPEVYSAITFASQNVYIALQTWNIRNGGSATFRFQTVEPQGLLFFNGGSTSSSVFIAVEVFDGKLYLVYNFGGVTKRVMFSEKSVDDGQQHRVSITINHRYIELDLDGQRRRIELQQSISGRAVNMDMVTPMFVGGVLRYDTLPWHLWSRRGFQGCLEDLVINGKGINLDRLSTEQFLTGIARQCTRLSGSCLNQPCYQGLCSNRMDGYSCDCTATSYTGDTCHKPAIIAPLNGNQYINIAISPQQRTHVNDISLRFYTPLSDALLFHTASATNNDYMRLELENGRLKLTTNMGGREKVMYVGERLNNNQWHTAYIRRRANHIEMWHDDGAHVIDELSGSDYYLNVDKIYAGSIIGDNIAGGPKPNNFIGYLQNFHFNDLQLLEKLRQLPSTAHNLHLFYYNEIGRLIPIVYNQITMMSRSSFLRLTNQRLRPTLISFMFKTLESSGVIFYAGGANGDFLAVELEDGYIRYIYDVNNRPAILLINTEYKVNDNKWHSVTIRHINAREQVISVDETKKRIDPQTQGFDVNLDRTIYVSGLPPNMYDLPNIRRSITSRHGFQGCLASFNLNGFVPDLASHTNSNQYVVSGCTTISSICGPDTCNSNGVCMQAGTHFWCDCNMTSFIGRDCTDEAVGYRFSGRGTDGMVMYRLVHQPDSSHDRIALGFMTWIKNGMLARIGSSTFKDYIIFRLENGHIVAEYDTGNGKQVLRSASNGYNDGKYHYLRFIRSGWNSTLMIDNKPGLILTHASGLHGLFNRMSTIRIGANQNARGNYINSFNGIISGVYVNELRVLDLAKNKNSRITIDGDVTLARHRFFVAKPGTVVPPLVDPAIQISIIGTVITPPTDTDDTTIIIVNPVVPTIGPVRGDYGGGGVAWIGGAGGGGTGGGAGGGGAGGGGGGAGGGGGGAGGGGGQVVGVYPGGAGGGGLVVPGGGGPVFGASVSGAGGGAGGASFAGVRAGAVMGSVLGVLALMSGLAWAFVRCKPGWCPCVSPAKATTPLAISPPHGGSNLSAVQAAAGAGYGGGIAANGSAAGGGGGAGMAGYSYYSTSSSAGGGGAGGGAKGGEGYDSATLRATGTFSNKGTIIGTPSSARSARAAGGEFQSSGYSSYTSSQVRSGGGYSVDIPDAAPASAGGTLNSYHYDTSGSSYGGSPPAANYQYDGTMGGYNTSTMSSTYNYQVQNVRTARSGGHMVAYGGSTGNITPGAGGDEVRVDCCLMTNDGLGVVTGSCLGPPQVWDMQSGELLRFMKGDTVGSTNLHLAYNDRLLVGAVNADLEINDYSTRKGVTNRKLQIWDFVSGRPLEGAEFEFCSALCVMNDGDKVVFGRSDKFGEGTNIVVWDLMGNQAIKEMRYDGVIGNNDYISYLKLSQNNRYVVAGFTNTFDSHAEFVVFDMTLTSYNVMEPSLLKLDAVPECTAILPKDEAVTGLRNGDLVIWSLRTGQPNRQLLAGGGHHAHTREVKAVTLSEDNKFLASACADGTIKVWDMATEREMYLLQGHTDEVWCVSISTDNEILVSGSRDGTIRLWRMRNGTEICAFNAHVDVFFVTMSKDKGTIVALGDKSGARKLIMLQVVRTKIKRQITE